jgi:isopentenyldiphosphate isomerase
MKTDKEYFDIIDGDGNIIGKALRSECHGNPELIHRTVHVVVFHPDGRMLLQKRNQDKDIQPGKWDTSVGGHIDSGENHETAVVRELAEELGVVANFADLKFLMDSEIRNEIESENVRIYSLIHPGPFDFQKEEISEVKFWKICELRKSIEETPEIFTPNLIEEIKQLTKR